MHRVTRGQRRELSVRRLLAAAHQRLENMCDVVRGRLRVNTQEMYKHPDVKAKVVEEHGHVRRHLGTSRKGAKVMSYGLKDPDTKES